MDAYILPGISFLLSSQESIAAAEPLAADFLKYQLSRTPTSKRFSRNANQAPWANMDPRAARNVGSLSIAKTGLRPATQKLISRPNVLENICASPPGHGQESHLPGSSADKTALKRPKKRHPLPSAPPAHQQRAALEETPNNRQFSIPDDERPAKAKKQKRPRIARNLPVDELELTEERLVLPFDAPPMSDSDEAESDPVEELPTGGVRLLRDPKKANVKPSKHSAKEKQILIRPSRRRPSTFTGFKIIKPLTVPRGANEKKTWQHSAIGDGFEGPERLPTGRNLHLTKRKRRPRQQVCRPTMYYRALEIEEFKPYEADFPAQPETLKCAVQKALRVTIAPRETADAVISDAALSRDLLMEAESVPDISADVENVVETIEMDAMNVEQDASRYPDSQAIKMPDASAQDSQAKISMSDVPIQDIDVDQELAPVLEKEGEEMVVVEEIKDVQSDRDENDVDNVEAPQDTRGDIETDSAPQVEDVLSGRPNQTQETGSPPSGTLIASEDKNRPVTKIKRHVIFSDEVKIQMVVEPEYEEEYSSEFEDQSQESDSESDKALGTDSTPENSQEEEYGSNDSDDDADDEEDNNEGANYPTTKPDDRIGSPELVSSGYYITSSSPAAPHFSFPADRTQSLASIAEEDDNEGANYPTTKLDDRIGSPELVSSGYYVTSSSPAAPHFIFHADRTQSPASIAEEDDNVEGDMILDMDDEMDEISQPPQYTPQSRKYIEEVADSEDEMLISTSGATSPEKMLMPDSDGIIDTDYGEEAASSDALAMQLRPSETAHKKPENSFTLSTQHNLDGAWQALFGIARFSKEPRRNFADSGIVMTSLIGNGSSAASSQSHVGAAAQLSRTVSRKIRRAKTGLELHISPVKPTCQASVRDVPSYFTQASQVLSSSLKNAQVMMRRARTLPSTQYINESGYEEGFIITDESFRERLRGRKRHLSLSDSVDYSNQVDLREVVRRSNEEMRRSGVARKRSRPFKSPKK